jgi:peptidoglycan/xylan/chitin deacetylase (PgdA/CDA1 family)
MQGPDSVRAVALTFDDGPHRWHTPKLLEILRMRGIKASFFVVGKCAAENPLLLQKIQEEGHCIANHSWSHPDLTRFAKDDLISEIRYCNQVVEALTGKRPKFFRPPGGRWNDEVLRIVSDEGLLPVLWTVNGYDVPPRPPEELAELILRRTRPGAIILLHDGGGATAEALPVIIERLLSGDYLFVTLDQMFPARVTPIPLVTPTDSKR